MPRRSSEEFSCPKHYWPGDPLTDKFHDRYIIIDNATLIHVGASLNYLGKRCFAFSTLDADFVPDIMARVP